MKPRSCLCCPKFVSSSPRPDGSEVGLYEDEVCGTGTCLRPPGHKGGHDQFDGPRSSDSVPMHPHDRVCQCHTDPPDEVEWAIDGLVRRHKLTDNSFEVEPGERGMYLVHRMRDGAVLLLYRKAGWWEWECRRSGQETRMGRSTHEGTAMSAALGAR